MTAILGISALYHDSAAAIIIDGEIIAAAQEERFTRIKHDPSYPVNAINYCLDEAGLSLEQVNYIAFYDKPFLKFERLLETYVAFAPRGFQSFRMAVPVWLREKLFLKNMLIKEIKKIDKNFDSNKLMFGEHHFSHAASAFYASPFEEAVVLTLDGVGEWATTTVAIGKAHNLEIVKEIHFPHSLGLLYSAFTYYTGFRVNSGEYKVMGLAPYGEPKYKDLIYDHLIDVKNDGSFKMNMDYFDYCAGLTMTNSKFHKLFGGLPRKPESKLTQKRKGFLNQLRYYWFVLIASLRDIGKEETIKEEKCWSNKTFALHSGTLHNILILVILTYLCYNSVLIKRIILLLKFGEITQIRVTHR